MDNGHATHRNRLEEFYKKSWTTSIPAEIDPARRLLERYSGLAPEGIDAHIYSIREKAWAIGPYACIGQFRFLNLVAVTRDPRYQESINRLTAVGSNETLLDVGCCVGQVLRQAIFDGAPSERLSGTDLHPEFLELGYELFRDRDKCKATFVAGDVFDDSDGRLTVFDGKMDVIHCASFFHLFDWNTQVKAAKRIIKFFKPECKNAMIFGRQVGRLEAGETELGKTRRYLHNADSWQRLWNEVGEATGTSWQTVVETRNNTWDIPTFGPEENKMRFGVYKIA